jgi:hypothetical protein
MEKNVSPKKIGSPEKLNFWILFLMDTIEIINKIECTTKILKRL